MAYAKRGIPVFPCEAGGKRPLTPSGFWDATTDPRLIEGWWRRWPGANVGIPTGKRSGLLVLDVDPREGGDATFDALERSTVPAPRTARARTGGGGAHLYFRYPTELVVKNSAGFLGHGLDVRGEGGYVLVPPSSTTGAYAWVDRSPPAGAAWLLGRLEDREKAIAEALAGGDTLF